MLPNGWPLTGRRPQPTTGNPCQVFSAKVDLRELGAYVAGGIWPEALDVALEARKRLPEQNFFDLRYADFMRDPIGSMERIYRYSREASFPRSPHFGEKFTL